MAVSKVTSANLKMRLRFSTPRALPGMAIADAIKGKTKRNRRINALFPAFNTFSVNKLLRR